MSPRERYFREIESWLGQLNYGLRKQNWSARGTPQESLLRPGRTGQLLLLLARQPTATR